MTTPTTDYNYLCIRTPFCATDRDHHGKACTRANDEARRDHYLGVALDVDAREVLDRIASAVEDARRALDDEREGDFTTAVIFLALDASRLDGLVRSW